MNTPANKSLPVPSDADIEALWSEAVRRNGTTTGTIREVVRGCFTLASQSTPAAEAGVPTVDAQVVEALRDLRSAISSRPSCQEGVVPRCRCLRCALERACVALATKPAPQSTPAITNSAPKRIYLDIGDQITLERVIEGGASWQSLDGVTWSEDNATSHGVAYVREDLATQPKETK